MAYGISYYIFRFRTLILSLNILVFIILSGEKNQDLLGLLLILSFGLLHGCNDLEILKGISNGKRKNLALALYVLIALLAIACFVFWPSAVLLLFGLLSCYHFGEQHWLFIFQEKTLTYYLVSFLTGIGILLLLFSLNFVETTIAIKELFDFQIASNWFYTVGLAALLVCGFLAAAKIRKMNRGFAWWLHKTSQWIVLAFIFHFGSLTIAFATYFVVFHSLPSILIQLKKNGPSVSLAGFKAYLSKTWMVWVTSLLALYVLYKVTANGETQFQNYLFGFLIAIASSHSILFHFFNAKAFK